MVSCGGRQHRRTPNVIVSWAVPGTVRQFSILLIPICGQNNDPGKHLNTERELRRLQTERELPCLEEAESVDTLLLVFFYCRVCWKRLSESSVPILREAAANCFEDASSDVGTYREGFFEALHHRQWLLCG